MQDTLQARQRGPPHHTHNNSHYIQKINRWNAEENLFIAGRYLWNTNLKICIAAEHYKKKIEMGKNKVGDMNGEHRRQKRVCLIVEVVSCCICNGGMGMKY